jgi:hypothetical protein
MSGKVKLIRTAKLFVSVNVGHVLRYLQIAERQAPAASSSLESLFVHLCQVGVACRRLEGIEERRHHTSKNEDCAERGVGLIREQAGDSNHQYTNTRSAESNQSHRSPSNFIDQKRIQNHSDETDNGDDERYEKWVSIS